MTVKSKWSKQFRYFIFDVSFATDVSLCVAEEAEVTLIAG